MVHPNYFKMKTYNSIKRIILFVVTFFMSLWSFAQTQYDYYEGKDAYGGVDTAIRGLKIFGIIFLVIAIIVIVGVIWAKTMDFFKPHQDVQSKPSSVKKTIEASQKTTEDIYRKLYDVITITGKSIEVYVTRKDGKKFKEKFWYEIENIKYNQEQEIKNYIGYPMIGYPDDCFRGGDHIEDDDIIYGSIKQETINYWMEKQNGFDPFNVQLKKMMGMKNVELYFLFSIYYGNKTMPQNPNQIQIKY